MNTEYCRNCCSEHSLPDALAPISHKYPVAEQALAIDSTAPD